MLKLGVTSYPPTVEVKRKFFPVPEIFRKHASEEKTRITHVALKLAHGNVAHPLRLDQKIKHILEAITRRPAAPVKIIDMHEPEQHLRDIFDNFAVVISDDVECGRRRLTKVPIQGVGFRYWDGLLGF